MIAVAWKHQNVFIDTSAHLPKYYPPVSALSFGLWFPSKRSVVDHFNTGVDSICEHHRPEEGDVWDKFPSVELGCLCQVST
jgi:predicted TIM-barrel fold metal-dependent hydrolase